MDMHAGLVYLGSEDVRVRSTFCMSSS